MLPPFSGGRFHIEVRPGESKIVLIKRLELIESNNSIVFYRSNLFYGHKTLFKLTKKKGIKKKRKDKETGKEVDINVYVFKHDFGIAYLYRNKTNNMILNEKVNIENGNNVEFYDENKDNKNNININIDIETQKEIKIHLPPANDYFLDIRSRNLLWKVNPVFTYSIEKLLNIENKNSEDNQSDSDNDSINENKNNEREFFKSEPKSRSRSLRTNSPSSIRNDNVDNFGENGEEKKSENDNNSSLERAGDSSDLSVSNSDDKSEDSN